MDPTENESPDKPESEVPSEEEFVVEDLEASDDPKGGAARPCSCRHDG